jgi:hypothetical protein
MGQLIRENPTETQEAINEIWKNAPTSRELKALLIIANQVREKEQTGTGYSTSTCLDCGTNHLATTKESLIYCPIMADIWNAQTREIEELLEINPADIDLILPPTQQSSLQKAKTYINKKLIEIQEAKTTNTTTTRKATKATLNYTTETGETMHIPNKTTHKICRREARNPPTPTSEQATTTNQVRDTPKTPATHQNPPNTTAPPDPTRLHRHTHTGTRPRRAHIHRENHQTQQKTQPTTPDRILDGQKGPKEPTRGMDRRVRKLQRTTPHHH